MASGTQWCFLQVGSCEYVMVITGSYSGFVVKNYPKWLDNINTVSTCYFLFKHKYAHRPKDLGRCWKTTDDSPVLALRGISFYHLELTRN